MGQRTKSTRPGLPHTGRPYGRVPLARHSKAYKYTLEEENRVTHRREQGIAQEKLINPSQKPDSPSRLKISLQIPSGYELKPLNT
ncbi:Transmembrane protein [Gossypium arboreum]|uniref:Transmembrane protein n=1 Tax=Gossypium arboreum TaxID=29729 RepID=A0A0B0N600_GOSAR|nr:Transmembrane protein [Gossypium arboreum]